MADNNWHTGKPIKIGFYLVTTAIENYHVRFFNGVRFCNHPKSLKILAWQKITPFEGEE